MLGYLGEGLTREQVIASLIVWGVWVLGYFLACELLGFERVAPWVTLSETVGWLEHGRALVGDLVCAFVLGVAIHWRFSTPFGRTEAIALAAGVVVWLTRFL